MTRDLTALPSVRVADVLKKGTPVARLRREPDGVVFEYRPEVVATGGPAVATTLAVRAEPVKTPAGAVPPFFAGLLPEGRRLTGLRRATKTSADDELTLLLAVGADMVGDVAVVPEGEGARGAEPLVRVETDWREVRFADLLAETGVVDPVGIPGAQEKASGRLISVPVARAHERWILKLDPPEYPHLVENEAALLALARETGMPVVDGTVVRDAEGRAGLAVRRFDRTRGTDGRPKALACEDACQALGRWPADKYAVSTEEVVRALARLCPATAVATMTLYRQLAFAWLTGNGDLHAKNVSVLEAEGGEWRVAPAYDLPATVPYGDRALALSVQGRTTGVSRKHWLALAREIGLPERAAVSVLDDLLERTTDLVDRVGSGLVPFDARRNRAWAAEARDRRRLLLPSR